MNRIYLPGFVQRAAADEEPGTPLRFIVATEGRKADGLNLLMKGANLERFKANPVVMPNHDYRQKPIGRAEEVSIEGATLSANAIFDIGSEEGAEYDRLYRNRFLNAVSIGFDINRMDHETGDVTEWEMIEFSAVSIPMDPSAVVESGRALTVARALARSSEGEPLSEAERAEVQDAIDSLTVLLPESDSSDPEAEAGERGLSRAAARLGFEHMERLSSI